MAENKLKNTENTPEAVAPVLPKDKPVAKKKKEPSTDGKTDGKDEAKADGKTKGKFNATAANHPLNKNRNKNKGDNSNFQTYMILGVMLFFSVLVYFTRSASTIKVNQKRFEEMMLSYDVKAVSIIESEKIAEITIKDDALKNKKYRDELSTRGPFPLVNGPHYYFNIISSETFKQDFEKINKKIPNDKQIGLDIDKQESLVNWLFSWGFLILLGVGFWYMMRRMSGGMGMGGAGGQLFNIGKSRAALFDKDNQVTITFKDVAGLDEAKEEVNEIVEFLKNPEKFTNLGGKIPKGALLVGPPGTGKTLLAKAVAGEAGVPFFSLSGSDFVEMFVGVGAARVRDLFKQAKEKAPCIVFIDEIDAVGRHRGKGNAIGGNDERENTLNSLLVEMDGFGTDIGVIILAATNRPDVLDAALMRPGRFDRQISIDKPDVKGREQIFRVHIKNLKLSEDVNTKKLATQTPGFAGAEIMNVCNEAALIAARHSKEMIDMSDFQAAIDRVIGGLEKKHKIISPEEKLIVAYHEAGHAVAGWFLEHVDPLVKVSIVPRGVASLGYAQYLPKEQFLYTTEQLFDEMCMTLGGRVAEDIQFKRVSTGALSDLERITKMAYSMVTIYGMNEKIGNVSFYDSKSSEYQFNKPYSEATAQTIDEEVRKLVDKAYAHTKALLIEKYAQLEIIALELLKKEVIFQADLEALIGKRPFEKATTYQEFMDTEIVEEEDEENPEAEKTKAEDGTEKPKTKKVSKTEVPPIAKEEV